MVSHSPCRPTATGRTICVPGRGPHATAAVPGRGPSSGRATDRRSVHANRGRGTPGTEGTRLLVWSFPPTPSSSA